MPANYKSVGRKKDKMTEGELTAIIDKRKVSGLNYRDGELSTRRENLLQRYLGKPYGTEREGQSKVVTRQCLEAVEWTLPSLLRVFMSSPTIAEFDPVGPEDEDAAKQETMAVNDAVFKKNDGFMTIYTWIKDTLMNPDGYIKVFWDEQQTAETEEYEGLLMQEADILLSEEGVTPLEQEIRVEIRETPMGSIQIEVVDLKIKRVSTRGKLKIEPVPPEELTIDDKLGCVSLEKADFVCHTTIKTRSDLIEMGFDEKEVYELPTAPELYDEARSRHDAAEERGTSLDQWETSDESTAPIEVDESYLYVDFDGDGIAEFRRVLSVGETVLENEEADMLPFVGMTSVPIPHVHTGASWMELVEDLQSIYTTITRQLLNNMYRTNNPRTVVGRGVNINDLLNDLPNQPIRAENIENMRTEPVAPVIGQVLPAFEMLDRMGERRTGVSKNTMGLDADSLSRVTKGAFLGSLEQANQRLEALARIIAESGIKPLMLKIHRLLLTHQTENYHMKVGGQWQPVNPSEWRERDDMTITVGLGTGNKQAQMMALEKVLETQGAMMQTPDTKMLVNPQNVFNAAAKMIEITGLHSPERYFVDPAKIPPQVMQQMQQAQNQPDPLAMAQMEMAKVEREKAQLKNQTDMASLQQKQMSERQKLEAQIAQLQAQLRKQDQDAALRQRELTRKEYEVMLDSELEQTKLTMENMRDLEAAQAQYRTGMD